MQRPNLLAPLIVWTFLFIGVIFTMFSLSFYFVYGNEHLLPVVFNVYSKESNMYLCAILFCCVLVIFVPLYNISNTELLERIGWIKNLVSDAAGDKSRMALVVFRWCCFLFFSLLALITEEVTVVLNLTGGLVIPIVSFYLPFTMNFILEKAYKRPRHWFMRAHDAVLLILGVIIQVIIMQYSIVNQLMKGEDPDIDF